MLLTSRPPSSGSSFIDFVMIRFEADEKHDSPRWKERSYDFLEWFKHVQDIPPYDK